MARVSAGSSPVVHPKMMYSVKIWETGNIKLAEFFTFHPPNHNAITGYIKSRAATFIENSGSIHPNDLITLNKLARVANCINQGELCSKDYHTIQVDTYEDDLGHKHSHFRVSWQPLKEIEVEGNNGILRTVYWG